MSEKKVLSFSVREDEDQEIRTHLGIKSELTPEEKRRLKYYRSRSLFPMLQGNGDSDSLSMLIFSYVNVKKRSL
jgi:hypothetical protein